MNVRKVRIGDLPVGSVCVFDFWGVPMELVVDAFDSTGIVYCTASFTGCKIQMFDADLVEVKHG